jgi:transposase
MPPAYVKPYVKRHKNDATDAEAICEAVTRPCIRRDVKVGRANST